ncbi:MAG TPA: thioredoxin domain-containing protein, partial [Desulfopila sp.]|nr:thioredoxin domain-containing protein [Desulfopila sp.]
SSSPQSASQHIDAGWSEIGFQSLRQIYDAEHHGFGTRNKFPRPATFSFLHAYGRRTGNEEAIAMARETLTAMAEGGMYDHLGGGFHRYSVDRLWRIPHFEKMLYDQAQLVVSYLEMFQLTGTPFFARVAEETIDYVLRDLRDPRGGLYSAEDADSVNPYNQEERGEGAFYLWQADEIEKLLDSDDAQLFLDRYGIEKNGNALEDPAEEFTGRNILYIHTSLAELAAERDMRITAVRESLDRSKAALFAQREQRIRPFLDDKILTSWNGLMLSALARAGRILGKSRYLKEAETVASFILENLMVDGRLLRRWRDGEARFDAVLEDYAFFIQGLLDLYDATHNCAHLRKAIDLSSQQIDLFADSDGGFFTSQEKPDLLTRMKETHDGAEPSGNSVAALNFLRLGRMLSQAKWTTTAEKTIRTFGSVLENQGSAMVLMLAALELSLHPPTQLVIAGNTSSPDTQALLTQVQRRYLPQLQVLLADRGENQHFLLQYIDHIGGMTRIENKSTAYLCKDYSCQAPTINPQKLAELLEQIS